MWSTNSRRSSLQAAALGLLVSLLNFTTSVHANIRGVYNREHFDDIFYRSDGSRTPARNGVIALYNPSCHNRVYSLGFSQVGSDYRLLTMVHDWQTSREVTWFKWTKDFDLSEVFDTTSCPSIYYLPKDKTQPFQKWNQEGSFRDWVWSKLERKAVITNNLDTAVTLVSVEEEGNSVPDLRGFSTVAAGASTQMNTYATHVVAVVNSQQQYVGHLVVDEGDENTLVIDASVQPQPFSSWLDEHRKAYRENLDVYVNNLWSHDVRHIMNFKQPPLIPKYTEKGYLKGRIPPAAYKIMKDYYDARKTKSSVEDWHIYGTQINFDAVKTRMVDLPENLKFQVAETIRPMLEAWSNEKLVFAALYGIREYFRGAILKPHTDRVETHVISAILNIDQDIDEDWLLEVIDFEGNKHQVPMKPGDMVFYESSKLIHGRPLPMKGRVFANAFLHFRPPSWSGYGLTNDNFLYTPDQRIPLIPVDTLGTKLTDIADHGKAYKLSRVQGAKEEL